MGNQGLVDIRRDGPVAIVALNRPERLNALSRAMVHDLQAALEEVAANSRLRVVVLTGEGRGFCAGTDLSDAVGSDDQDDSVRSRYELQQRVARLVLTIRDIPQPVIAALHGPAAGGGLSLAAACDIRVADPSARFNAAFVRLGASGGDLGSSWFLPRLIGPGAAADMLYTGRFVEASEALTLRLVDRLVPDGEDLEAAHELANAIVTNAPMSTRMTKELLNASLGDDGLRRHLALENRTQILCTYTDDFHEGVAAFHDRRPPHFRDR